MAEVNNVLPEADQVDLKFSNGMIQKFKGRHGIRSVKMHGESGSADLPSDQEALPKMHSELDV